MDIYHSASLFLAQAKTGTSYSQLADIRCELSQSEIKWLTEQLLEKGLLYCDDSLNYWTTTEGIKFLEIQFNMEKLLKIESSV